MSQAGYQDRVLINICFLDNVRSLFWQEFIEYEIFVIKILKPAIFCFLQYFFPKWHKFCSIYYSVDNYCKKEQFFPLLFFKSVLTFLFWCLVR